MEIYDPGIDSFLLEEALISFLNGKEDKINILDMGTGSGILGETCIRKGFFNTVFADINPESVRKLKSKGLNAIKSNLFKSLKNKKFDLIIFNPPYLPLDKLEPKDSRLITTAGKKGNEIIVRFLKEAKSHLNYNGKILLLFSSLSRPKLILSFIKALGFSYKLKKTKKLFFEELYVYEIY